MLRRTSICYRIKSHNQASRIGGVYTIREILIGFLPPSNYLKRIRWLSLPLFVALVLSIGSADSTPQENAGGNLFLVDRFPSSCIVNGTSYTTQADFAF